MSNKPFLRYEGAVTSDDRRMAPATSVTYSAPRTLGELLGRLETFTESDKERTLYWWADRFVLGYPLAPWQRPVVWSQEQQIKFIISLWEDVDVGTYLVNDIIEFEPTPPGAPLKSIYLSDVLLDGQQRLTAIQSYLLNEFPVPDAKGVDCFWKDLTKTERRFFANKSFPMSRMQTFDETVLRHAYNLRAFAGVKHTEDQRA